MSLLLAADPLPLAPDREGTIRVGGTRVTLDTVVGCYLEGMTAEGVVEQYPSLRLADVYRAFAYFLDHRAEVEAYLRARQEQAAPVRAENERRFDPNGVRARLLARRP